MLGGVRQGTCPSVCELQMGGVPASQRWSGALCLLKGAPSPRQACGTDQMALLSHMLMNYLCPRRHFQEMCNLLVLSPTGASFGFFLWSPTAGEWKLKPDRSLEGWVGEMKEASYVFIGKSHLYLKTLSFAWHCEVCLNVICVKNKVVRHPFFNNPLFMNKSPKSYLEVPILFCKLNCEWHMNWVSNLLPKEF